MFHSSRCGGPPLPRSAQVLAWVLAGLGGLAAAPPLDPARAMTQYAHAAWGLEEGLPQSAVTALVRSRTGHLWLGTQEGLACWDGQRFTVYERASEPLFRAGMITRLLEDREGTLWVGTTDGLLTFRQGRFNVVRDLDVQPSRHVMALGEGADGSVWVGTQRGLCRIQGTAFRAFGPADGLPEAPFHRIHRDAQGGLWAGGDLGLYREEGGRFRRVDLGNGQAEPFVFALADARDGGLWIGTRYGLLHHRDGAVRALPGMPGMCAASILDLHEDAAGTLWLATVGEGVLRLREGQVSRLARREGLGSDIANCLLEDLEGNLWVGTSGSGLHRLRSGPVANIGAREGLPSEMVWCVAGDGRGGLWIGTSGGGLVHRQPGGACTTLGLAQGLPGMDVTTLHMSARHGLCVGTRNGFALVKDGRLRQVPFAGRQTLQVVRSFCERKDGSLWLASDGRLHVFDGRRIHPAPVDLPGLSRVQVMLEDAQGALWIGTTEGLWRVQGDRRECYGAGQGLPSANILSLFEAPGGVLWIGTGSGLARLEAGRIQALGAAQGLREDTLYALVPDQRGRLWFSTTRGIGSFALADAEACAQGRLSRIPTRMLGRADGMASAECNGGSSSPAWRGPDGLLHFATTKGLAILDPERAQDPGFQPAVCIEELEADGRQVPLRAGLEFPPGTGRLAFRFAPLGLADPQSLICRFKLEGSDRDWVDAGAQRMATYTNLPPGRYTLRVMVLGADGRWAEPGASFTFVQRPRFYQHPLFPILGGLAILALGAALPITRQRRLRARARELDRLVRERTRELEAANRALAQASAFKSTFLANTSHELRTPLNAVLGLARFMEEHRVPEAERRQFLGTIRHSAESLLRLMNDLLDLGKIEAGRLELECILLDLRALLEQAAFLLAERAQEKGLELLLRVDPRIPRGLLGDPGRIQQAVLNLLANAVKFTHRGHVRLEARLLDAQEGHARVELSVEDTGIGLAPEVLERVFEAYIQAGASTAREYGGTGLGLFITRQLAGLMGGQTGAKSEPGRGSTFWLTAELRRGPEPSPPEPLLQGLRARGAGFGRQLAADLAEWVQQEGGVWVEDGEADLYLVSDAQTLARFPVGARRICLAGFTETVPPERLEGAVLLRKPFGEAAFRQAVAQTLVPGGRALPAAPRPWFRGVVLVADDSPGNRMLAEAMLARLGLKVRRAADGREALRVLEAEPVDLAFLDGRMPIQDGFATAMEVRAREAAGGPWEGRHLPLVALTGLNLPREKERLAQAGFDAHLPKPLEREALVAVLERFLGSAERVGREEAALDTDRLLLLEEALGGREALRSFVAEAVLDSAQRLDLLRDAAQQGDLAQLERLAHDFKSNAASLGLEALSEAARELEQQGPGGPGDLERRIGELARLFQDARKALAGLLSGPERG